VLWRARFFQAFLDSVTLLDQNLDIHEIASGARLLSHCVFMLFRDFQPQPEGESDVQARPFRRARPRAHSFVRLTVGVEKPGFCQRPDSVRRAKIASGFCQRPDSVRGHSKKSRNAF